MKKFCYQVGIDVAKSTLDCTVLQEGKKLDYQRIANTPKAVKSFLQQLEKQGIHCCDTLFCMEHTGVYNAHILQVLIQNKANIWLEAALRIKESLGFTRGKNDKVDSYRIARYAYLHQDSVVLWVPRREVVQQLTRLTILRKRLVKTKVALLQPLDETKQFLGNKAFREERALTNPIASTLKRQIKQVEKQIEEVIKSDEHLSYLFELVTSVEAIGPVTAGHLLVVTARRPPMSLEILAVLKNLSRWGTTATQVQPLLKIVPVLASEGRVVYRLMLTKTPKSYCIWQRYPLLTCKMNWQPITSVKSRRVRIKWRSSMR